MWDATIIYAILISAGLLLSAVIVLIFDAF